jgi:hypothetical protein
MFLSPFLRVVTRAKEGLKGDSDSHFAYLRMEKNPGKFPGCADDRINRKAARHSARKMVQGISDPRV